MLDLRRTCRFGSHTVELGRRRLLRGGVVVPLSPTAFDLLLAFLESPGVVLSREELLARVWGDRHVEDGALSHYVSQLRQALGEDRDTVSTLPRRGYVFSAAVAWSAEAASETAAAEKAPPAAPRPRQRLARLARLASVLLLAAGLAGPHRGRPAGTPPLVLVVLPFSGDGGGPAGSSLGIGFAESLAGDLGRVPGLVVPAVGPTLLDLEAAGDALRAAAGLGADAVLTGAVRLREGGVEVAARLLTVPQGRAAWQGAFARSAPELAALQDTLASAVVGELGLRRSAAARAATESTVPAAQRAYRRGRHNQAQVTAESFARARRYYREALALDPGFVQAAVELASLTQLEGYYGFGGGNPFERYREAAAMLEPILRQHPDHALALDLQGRLHDTDWEPRRAIASYRRALQVAPFDPRVLQHLAWSLLATGDEASARSAMEVAALVDTEPLRSTAALGYLAHYTRRQVEAVEIFREVLAIEPRFARAHLGIAAALTELGHYEEAERHLAIADELNGDPREPLAALAYLYAVSGRDELARQAERRLEALAAGPAQRAMVVAALGDVDRGIAMVEQAVAERSLSAADLAAPQFAPLHGHPGWARLRARARGEEPPAPGEERIFPPAPLLASR